MMMYFEFNEDKANEIGLTIEQCHLRIYKWIKRNFGLEPCDKGTFIVSEEKGYYPFGNIRLALPKVKWFMECIEKWYWFEDENDIDWNSESENCLLSIRKFGS